MNWGSLDKGLVAQMMDENARMQPLDADQMMREVMVASALQSAARAEQIGAGPRSHHPVVQDEPVQDLIGVYRALADAATMRYLES